MGGLLVGVMQIKFTHSVILQMHLCEKLKSNSTMGKLDIGSIIIKCGFAAIFHWRVSKFKNKW